MNERGLSRTGALLLSALFFWYLNRWDNKYTRPGSQPIAVLLVLSEEEAAAHPLRYLIREWEFYPGALLTPDDFQDGIPPRYRQYVSVGQYGGLEAGNAARSPHGSGAYRLTLSLPEPEREWALELPAVYSAWKLYIGGNLAAQMGDPDPQHYLPRMGDRTVTFTGAGDVTLLLAVSDYSGFYGGMTTRPPSAIRRRWTWRGRSACCCAWRGCCWRWARGRWPCTWGCASARAGCCCFSCSAFPWPDTRFIRWRAP